MVASVQSTAVNFGTVTGQTYGLEMPVDVQSLLQSPLPFLTNALRAYGVLAQDNAVATIVAADRCGVGSTGEKLLLTVEYARPEPSLPTRMFVKFSRNFDDPFHDRRRFELESEIAFYDLARRPGFPVAVPQSLFGDFHAESGTGLLIIEQIPFEAEGVEPLHEKCMDHTLDRARDHYSAIVTVLARLAGGDRAGTLGDRVEAMFPYSYDEAIDEDPILASEEELLDLVDDFASLQRDCPALFPVNLRDGTVVERLRRCVITVVRNQRDIKAFLNSQEDLIALSHFNANIDNAWFWQNEQGALECGLFDWQRARRMNLAYAMWGGLCAAGLSIWNADLDSLLAEFVAEYHAAGGPKVSAEKLREHLHLYSAYMGVAGLLGAARLVRERVPNVHLATGPTDPIILENEGARCFLHVFTSFLNFLEMDDFANRLPAQFNG